MDSNYLYRGTKSRCNVRTALTPAGEPMVPVQMSLTRSLIYRMTDFDVDAAHRPLCAYGDAAPIVADDLLATYGTG